MKEFKLLNKLQIRAVVEFIALSLFFSVIGYGIYLEIDKKLTESLEESVAQQSQTLAFGLKKQFEEEFKKLRSCATLAEQGKISYDTLIELSVLGTTGESMGVITKEGAVIAGSPLTIEEIWLFESVFKGENAIKYRTKSGLMFGVPIKINGQTCLLYDKFNDDFVRQRFMALSYNGAGTIIFANGKLDDQWMVLSYGEELINLVPEMVPGWQALTDKFKAHDNRPTAIFYKINNNGYFLHCSLVSTEYKFFISGYAPWDAVAVGIDYIYVVMVVTFIVIMILLIFAVRYMMKNREAETLANEKVLADSANQAKSAFLASMSHEIRTPINAIMGMDEMIMRESKDKEILEYAENLQNAARTLLGLVNDILDFSKIEAGKMEIINVEYHISSILNDLINMLSPRAEKKGLELKVNASPDLPSVLYGDEIRIKQVITNLLTNAVKYTEAGSVELNVSAQNIDEEKIYLCVSVKDTGIGIKQEDISKLFSAFERIEEERNRTIEGTGLGMNITKKLLKMMNSKLNVESVYGKGSTFSFQIEQRVINNEPIGDFQENYRRSLNSHKEYHELFTAPDAQILVVDDTVMNLTVVKGLLK